MEVADTQWPHPLCKTHATIFYTKIVRIGSALAELERAAPSGITQWEQQPDWPLLDPADVADRPPLIVVPPLVAVGRVPWPGDPACRWPGCVYAPKTRWGTLCAEHLRETYVIREAHLRRARELVKAGLV
jgi:hypothetical protein